MVQWCSFLLCNSCALATRAALARGSIPGSSGTANTEHCKLHAATPQALVANMSNHEAASSAARRRQPLQPLDRRATLQGFAAATTTTLIPLPPATAAAAVATALKTVSWSATDGFDSDFPSQINFIEFDEKAYRAMRMTRDALQNSPRPYERASRNSKTPSCLI